MSTYRSTRKNTTTFITHIIVAVASSFFTLLAAYKWPGIMDIFAPAAETAALDKDSVAQKDVTAEAEKPETETPAATPAKAAAPTTPAETSDAATHDIAEGTAIYVNGDGVRLRTGPGLNYDIYTKVNTGQALTYNYTSGDWYCVKYNGRNLFINKDFATTKATAPKTVKAPAPDTQSSKTPKDSKPAKKAKAQNNSSDKAAKTPAKPKATTEKAEAAPVKATEQAPE